MENTVGSRLRTARRLRKMTQAQLAKRARVAQSSISELETNESAIPAGDSLLRLCLVLRIYPAWLISNAGPMELPDGESLIPAALHGEPPSGRLAELSRLWPLLPSTTRDAILQIVRDYCEAHGRGVEQTSKELLEHIRVRGVTLDPTIPLKTK